MNGHKCHIEHVLVIFMITFQMSLHPFDHNMLAWFEGNVIYKGILGCF